MKQEEKELLIGRCIDAYKQYLEEKHIDPSAKEFTKYWTELQGQDEDVETIVSWKKAFSNISELRLTTIKRYPELGDLTLNESHFTAEYKEKLLDEISNHKKFILSTAVVGKMVNLDFYKSLKTFARDNNAMLIFFPMQDVRGSKKQFEYNFDPILKNDWILLEKRDTKLNTNLQFEGIKQSAKQKNPLLGLEKISSKYKRSIVVAGTKQLLQYVPAMKDKVPRAIMTTGAVTDNNYDNDNYMSARTERLSEMDHQYGAVIIEVVDEDIFHFRQVQASENGSFTDLNRVYHPDGTNTEAKNSLLVIGDTHAGAHDEYLFQAIVGDLSAKCNISEFILHDVCNASSISHHEEKDSLLLVQRAMDGTDSLLNDVENVSKYLTLLGYKNRNAKITVVNSNHDNHILRAMKERFSPVCNRHYNAKNEPILMDLFMNMLNEGVTIPIKYLVEKYSPVGCDNDIQWLELDESYVKYGVELGMHGHLGANGAKGSLKTFDKTIVNAVVGHAHSGAICCDIFQVGTTSEMRLGYNTGLSSWTRTCCLVHEDGTKQLINFIPYNGGYCFTA